MSGTFTPNPSAEANVAFDVVKPGVYRMRVKEITNTKADGSLLVSGKGNKYFKVKLEYTDPTSLLKMDESPVTNPGIVFDNGLVYEPKEAQGRLRNFVEGCGVSWIEAGDADVLVGKEVDVKIGLKKTTEQYPDEGNEVKRYISIK